MTDEPIGREAAIKSLKEFTKADWGSIDENFGETIFHETDRGAVILAATAIEDVLANAVRSRMVNLSADEAARLFGPDAPLGSFSARIRMAYALGIIDREQQRMCDLLREMRNACAHSRRALSFKHKALRDVLFAAMRYISVNDYAGIKEPHLLKLMMLWMTGWLTRSIRTGSKATAYEHINRLIAEAVAEAEAAASKQKRPARPSPSRPRSRKAKPPSHPPRSSEA